MTFADYMRLCLYDPAGGYYTKTVPGRGCGYETAPTLSPEFGRCVAQALSALWEAMGSPSPFVVAEVGPGDGSLAESVLDSSIVPELRWVSVEPHSFAESLQRSRLAGRPVEWSRVLPECHCVVANEVLDNFPVHLVLREGASITEAYVADGRKLVMGEPSDDRIVPWVESYVPDSVSGWIEVALDAVDWITALTAPYVLVMDYGDESGRLYVDRPKGTLEFWRGRPLAHPFGHAGDCDISAHVNFSALQWAAAARGRSTRLVNQRDFLLAFGLRRSLDELAERARVASGAEQLALQSARNDAAMLANPRAMGSFKVLLACDGVPVPHGWPRDASRARLFGNAGS